MDWEERIGRRLTLRDLRILLAAVDAGSVSRAAAQLRVSQPAISKTISQIERAVAAQLVKRSSRGIEPTAQGKALLDRVRAAFRELRDGVEAIDSLSYPKFGDLRIAGNQVTLSNIVPTIITRLYSRHPGLIFNVLQAQTSVEQIRMLEEERADLFIGRIAQPLAADHLRFVELFRDDFVVVAGPDNPWKRRKKIALSELVGELWTLPPPETVTGQSMANIFKRMGLAMPRVNVAASTLQLHQRLVLESNFLTFLPSSLARTIPGLHVLPAPLDLYPQSVGVLTLKYRTQSPLAKLFIDEAQAASREFQSGGSPLAEALSPSPQGPPG